jgi:hypothetical protein
MYARFEESGTLWRAEKLILLTKRSQVYKYIHRCVCVCVCVCVFLGIVCMYVRDTMYVRGMYVRGMYVRGMYVRGMYVLVRGMW